MTTDSDPWKYWAFISYSHRDRAWGDWLHRRLETYRVPRSLIGKAGRDGAIPRRIFPVFRDREELPSSADLGSNIEQGLAQSRALVVICSPRSAQSRWVAEEVLLYKRMGHAGRVLCLIVAGEPNASDRPGEADAECFPEAVRFALGEDGALGSTRMPGRDAMAQIVERNAENPRDDFEQRVFPPIAATGTRMATLAD